MFSRIHKGEEGVAIITALLTSTIVVILGTTVVQLAIHNSEGSAYDRRNVQSIAAAESGIDYYFSWLTATGGQQPPCSVTRPMVGSPGSFTVTPVFYDELDVPMQCPPPSDPAAVLLNSVGSSSGSSTRTMQAYAKLTTSTGGSFDNAGAVFGEDDVLFNSNATLGGNNFADADIYTNGDVYMDSNAIIYGKLYAQGTLTMKSNVEVKKDVWTKGSISMDSNSIIRGSATASGPPTASITLQSDAHIYGGAKASGSITGGTVDVYRSPNQSGLQVPPSRTYPAFTFVAANWTAAGYTNQQTFTGASACSSAESYIKNSWTSGPLLVRIAASGSTCQLTLDDDLYNIWGNLAIISDGQVNFDSNALFSLAAGTSADVFLMAGLSGTDPCDISMDSNSRIGPGLVTLLYVPSSCTVEFNSNASITEGQVIGGSVNFNGNAQFAYERLTVPGTGAGGFKQDVVYKREIID